MARDQQGLGALIPPCSPEQTPQERIQLSSFPGSSRSAPKPSASFLPVVWATPPCPPARHTHTVDSGLSLPCAFPRFPLPALLLDRGFQGSVPRGHTGLPHTCYVWSAQCDCTLCLRNVGANCQLLEIRCLSITFTSRAFCAEMQPHCPVNGSCSF